MIYLYKVLLHTKKWTTFTKWQHINESQRHNVVRDEPHMKKIHSLIPFLWSWEQEKLVVIQIKIVAAFWEMLNERRPSELCGVLDVFCMLISVLTTQKSVNSCSAGNLTFVNIIKLNISHTSMKSKTAAAAATTINKYSNSMI